jgi:hypothetical protein
MDGQYSQSGRQAYDDAAQTAPLRDRGRSAAGWSHAGAGGMMDMHAQLHSLAWLGHCGRDAGPIHPVLAERLSAAVSGSRAGSAQCTMPRIHPEV